MSNYFEPSLNPKKSKTGVIMVALVIVFLLGIGIAFMVFALNPEIMGNYAAQSTDNVSDQAITENNGQSENNVTDDEISDDQQIGGAGSIRMKSQDGVTMYSTDGGETWSEEVPEGFSDIIGGDHIPNAN